MYDEKWLEIKDNIKNKFELLEERAEDIIYKNPINNQEQKIGKREILDFITSLGELRFVREKRLLVKEKKHHYHKTKADAVVELIFTNDEYLDKVKVFRKDGERWKEVEEKRVGMYCDF